MMVATRGDQKKNIARRLDNARRSPFPLSIVKESTSDSMLRSLLCAVVGSLVMSIFCHWCRNQKDKMNAAKFVLLSAVIVLIGTVSSKKDSRLFL